MWLLYGPVRPYPGVNLVEKLKAFLSGYKASGLGRGPDSEPSWEADSEPSWEADSEPSWQADSEPSWEADSEPSWEGRTQSHAGRPSGRPF